MSRLLAATLACLLAGCATTAPPGGYSVCATDPGGYACQIERYQLAG